MITLTQVVIDWVPPCADICWHLDPCWEYNISKSGCGKGWVGSERMVGPWGRGVGEFGGVGHVEGIACPGVVHWMR